MEEDDELDMDSPLDDKGFLPPGSYYFDTQYTTTFIMMFIVIAMLLSLVAFLISVIIKKRIQAQPKPRFRKRDKVMFYGRKMLRKVKSISGPVYTVQRKMRKRKEYMDLAKTIRGILQHTDSDRKPMLQVKEPPPAILEADFRVLQLPPEFRIPTEVLYMLKNIRVFGHFERPLFLELSRSVESKFLPAGAYLFQRGQPDDSIFVVQCGRLVVYITEPDGSEYEVKEVTQGDSVHSLLSVLDVITGYSAPYKTVSCKAAEDTTVLRLPAVAFQAVFEQYPESMVRVVQMMMIRLQRVTFLTLQNLLGLDAELINPDNISSKSLAIHAMNSKAGSPTKRQTSVVSTPATTAGGSSSALSTSSAETVLRVSMAEEATDVFKSAEESDGDLRQRGRSGSVTTPSARVLGPISNWRRATSLDVDDTGRLSMSTSDFEAAAGRARVTGLDDTKPLRQISLENAAAASSKSGGGRKRAMSLEGVSERSSEEKKDYSEDEILEMAKRDLMTLFGLPDTSLLDHQIALSHIPVGSVVVKEGDQETNLMFLLKGSFLMLQTDEISGKERTVFVVSHGEMIGELAVLTGEPALFTVKARQDCCVIAISKTRFYSIMREYPQVVLKVGHQVVKKLSSFVRQTDFALDWMQLEAGKAVYRQGDQSQCTYIVLNGRLRSVVQLPSGKRELMGEFGRGEIVGIVEVLTLKERVTTVHAIRDTELAKLPTGMLNLIKRKFPHTVTRLIEILGQRLLGQVEEKMGSTKLTAEERRTTVENLSTVALIPGSDDVPLARFALELTHSLSAVGSVLRLTKEHILQTLGGSALDSVHEYRLTSWLGQQEDLHNIVLYQADKRMTAWTQRCIRQADCILIVALADRDPNNVSEMETQLEALAVRAQKELILLHREKDGIYKPPSGTAEWLNARGWCVSHHHIRCPKRMFSKRSPARVRETYDRLFDTKADTMSDFSRLARFLTGTSIGLVLGGGGARGISQLGIIKAMEEYGIPIDIVGGVSIGALISALYAEDVNSTIMEKRLQGFCKDFGSLWKRVIDLTYPSTAMFTGHNFNKSISDLFGDKQIEDLWLPYFTISTDITKYALRLHTSGSLWRYVRASMSLSGYLPPLCDPKDGHLLLDGGYVNNLPADIMRAMGVPTIIAIDVGSEDTSSITNYGDELSGWWLLWKKWNPWTEPVRVPSLDEIQSRLAYVSSMKMLDEVKNSSYCEYMRPPINNFATLAFHRHREIMEVGYHHGMTVFSGWKKSGYLQALLSEKSSTLHKRGKPGLPNMHPRFTDLAALVTRMEPQKQAIPDPDEVDYARVEGTGDTDVGMETDGIGTESASEMNPSSDVPNATNSETVTRSASAPSTVIGSEISSEDASEDDVEVEVDASGSTHSSIRKKVEGLRLRRHRSESSPSE
ncbi:patatin-like phospholipase domain-containing protein 7 [Strongylocentrotus purpuratus]|uniref:lysophospholipase n=1 Tax=Strongylocentrotus purpuratus TaxID=7668 RepID=A0A7M7PPZ1_STRPU|nr:patatin-like phospholipase domain-containing protein 7 [Strongylocentrotus purpuratus]